MGRPAGMPQAVAMASPAVAAWRPSSAPLIMKPRLVW
jgi:hypothetical protein